MAQPNATCIYCGMNDSQAPLVPFQYQGKDYHICPQHLPIFIHHPEQLAGKLPGAEKLVGGDHNH